MIACNINYANKQILRKPNYRNLKYWEEPFEVFYNLVTF